MGHFEVREFFLGGTYGHRVPCRVVGFREFSPLIIGAINPLLVWESTTHLPSHDCHYLMLRSFSKMDVSD